MHWLMAGGAASTGRGCDEPAYKPGDTLTDGDIQRAVGAVEHGVRYPF
jgi:hypothetical protein